MSPVEKDQPLEKGQPELWKFVPLLSSGTMRWLLVAGATWAASLTGVPEALAPEQAERWVQLFLQVVQGVAIIWAGYHRYSNATPPLARSKKEADAKNAARR
jgi:hypothetical protein